MTNCILAILVALSVVTTQAQPSRGVLYASAGAELTQYDIDTANASLVKRSSVRLPANVQYAWPHITNRYFYVTWSDGGASAAAPGAASPPRGKAHGVTAFGINPSTGALTQIGQAVSLAARPIHVSVDRRGTHLLIAYNDPSTLTVHRLNADGSIGTVVKQSPTLDTGIYAHQILVDSSNKAVFLVTRGNGPTKDKAEDRGAVKVFGYADGVLTNRASIAPEGGVNFQPRHLDFHPSKPWFFLSLERQSKLQVYANDNSRLPLFTKDSLADKKRNALRQNAGTVHVHPNGRFVYQANRSAFASPNGKAVDGGGENSIAVYAVNQQTGEPMLIQNIDTRGAEPRTFALDPSAKILVAGNQTALFGGLGANKKTVPASLAVFRVREDGKLDFGHKYDVDTSMGSLFWMGIVRLP